MATAYRRRLPAEAPTIPPPPALRLTSDAPITGGDDEIPLPLHVSVVLRDERSGACTAFSVTKFWTREAGRACRLCPAHRCTLEFGPKFASCVVTGTGPPPPGAEAALYAPTSCDAAAGSPAPPPG
jgi:hypothetical protein